MAPSRSDEYLLYQTLSHLSGGRLLMRSPSNRYRKRIQDTCEGRREAKVRTSWRRVRRRLRDALLSFVAALLEPPDNRF